MLTLLLATTALMQTPDAPERDLSVTVELTGGRQLGASAFVDYGILPDVLYLNGGYSLAKPPAVAAEGSATGPTHIFFLGVDWSLGRHLTLSALFSASPNASDSLVLNPKAAPRLRVGVVSTRNSLGGSLMAAWNSAGLSKLEWVVDAGVSMTANRLRSVLDGPLIHEEVDDPLTSVRGLLGVTLTILDDTDLSLRGGLTGYTADPLKAGRFRPPQALRIRQAANTALTPVELEALARVAQQASTLLGRVDALAGYASAPIWAESKIALTHRFGDHWSGQLGWTFDRYVPTAGHANIISARVTFKINQTWRLWLGGLVQFDEPLDQPSLRTPTDPQPSISGLGTLGAELTL